MKYKLSANITVSCYCEVEAASKNEALEIASGLSAAIGGLHSGVYPNENWVIEDADGEPQNIHFDD